MNKDTQNNYREVSSSLFAICTGTYMGILTCFYQSHFTTQIVQKNIGKKVVDMQTSSHFKAGRKYAR